MGQGFRPSTSGGNAIEAIPDAPDAYTEQPFGQLVRRMAGNASVYTLGTIGVRFGGLLLIPIYWRFLDPVDYGTLAVTAIVSTFVSVLLGLAVTESITRFYHAWPAAERRERLGAVWMLDWGSSLLIGVPLALWGGKLIQPFLQVPFDPYIRVALWSAIFTSFANTPLMTLRIPEKPRPYVLSTGALFVLRTGLAVILVWKGMGVMGVLLADLVSGLLMIPFYVVLMLRRARPVFRLAYMREALGYSLPLVPAVGIDAVMLATDRFLLQRYVSLRDLGLYAAGDQLGSVVRMVTIALKPTWVPFEMRTAVERPQDGPRIIARMATYFAAVILLVALAVAALSGDAVQLIGVEKYRPVAGLVPLFAVPHMIPGFLTLLGGGLGIARQTQYAWPTALTQLVVVVVGNVLLIPLIGLYGAILCSALGFLVRTVLVYALSQRFYPIPFEWPKIAWLLGGAVYVYALAASLPIAPSLPGLMVRGGLVAAYALAGGYFILDGRAFLRGRRIAKCELRIAD